MPEEKKQETKFDFSPLWKDEETEGFSKFYPLLTMIMQLIIIGLFLWKK